MLHGSARGLRFFDEAHHLAENAVGTDGGGAVFERAVEIERSADDAIAGFSRDGEGFAGDQGFIDGGDAGENDAVDGDALARAENHDVASDDLGEGDFDFGTIAEQARRLRLELHEFVQGIEGAALRARIEPSAEQQEAEDEEDRVVVNVGVEAVAPENAGHGGGGERICERCAGAQSHEGVHVGGAMDGRSPGLAIDDAAAPDHSGESDGQHDVLEGARRNREQDRSNGRQPVLRIHEQHHENAAGESEQGFRAEGAFVRGGFIGCGR